jgi:hypothetical protein
MSLKLKEKMRTLLAIYTFALLVSGVVYALGQTEKKVVRYIVCPDGQDTCTPYEPHEVKVIYR